MPLIHSKSNNAFKKNVGTLTKDVGKSPHVKSQDQALAIAFSEKRRARADGGRVFEGPILSAVPGRTDRHEMEVGSGSYVLPSSHISSLGEDNTLAGMDYLKRIGAKGIRRLAHASEGASAIIRKHRAKGGGVNDGVGQAIPIIAAGGEVVLPPRDVAIVGDGDVSLGHRLLDNWVVKNRAKHVRVLSKLKPPARD